MLVINIKANPTPFENLIVVDGDYCPHYKYNNISYLAKHVTSEDYYRVETNLIKLGVCLEEINTLYCFTSLEDYIKNKQVVIKLRRESLHNETRS